MVGSSMETMETNKKTKILYLITKSNWGGAGRYVYDLTTSLPEDKFDVVVALGGEGLLKQRLEEKGVRVITVKSLERNVSILKEFSALFELYSLFEKERPDVVHLNSSKAGGLGAFAARLSGIPRIVFTAHGWAFGEKRFLLHQWLIWMASLATQVFSHVTIAVSTYD